MSTFFLQRPADKFYNIGRWSHVYGYPYPVIEGELFVRPEVYEGEELIHRLEVKIINPLSIAEKWPAILAQEFIRVEGPQRNLTTDEYKSFFPEAYFSEGWWTRIKQDTQNMLDSLTAPNDDAQRATLFRAELAVKSLAWIHEQYGQDVTPEKLEAYIEHHTHAAKVTADEGFPLIAESHEGKAAAATHALMVLRRSLSDANAQPDGDV